MLRKIFLNVSIFLVLSLVVLPGSANSTASFSKGVLEQMELNVFNQSQSQGQDRAKVGQIEEISKEQIAAMIQTQGKRDKDSYYIEGLSYSLVNLDDDSSREIVAKIDGGVHLGQFFIFDEDLRGEYKLIAEENWKVEEWDFTKPIELDGKNIFKLVTRTGGTGLDIFTAHFFYLDQGKFAEIWQGTLLERSMMAGPETFYKKAGGYQLDVEDKRLYQWETAHKLKEDGITPLGEIETITTVYLFNGTTFIEEKSSPKGAEL